VSAAAGINLAGHLSAPQGLGVAARNTTRLLDAKHVDWAGFDVPPPAATAERVPWASGHARDPRERAPHAVNLLHLNPPEVLELLWERPRWLELDGHVTACVPFWEFPRVPPVWIEGLACMDAVLAPSHFVERAVRAALPDLPVFHFPQAVWLDATPALLPHAEVTGMALEYGTVDGAQVMEALRADNWLHLHGDPLSPQGQAIGADTRAAFYIDTDIWRGMVLGQSLIATRQALTGLARAL